MTYESSEQWVNGNWKWTSINQQVSYPHGNGITGKTFNVPIDEEGKLWILNIDAGVDNRNPFSVKLNDKDGNWLPMYFESVFSAYGGGPISFGGSGLPQAGSSGFTLDATNAQPNAKGILFVSLNKTEILFPNGEILYVSFPFIYQKFVQFDSAGDFSLSASVPPGTLGIELFMQIWAEGTPIDHSNGLRMTIIP